MLTAEKKITLEEYLQLPIGAPFQYIDGRLVDWPSRTPIHQFVLGQICQTLGNYSDLTQNKGWFIIGPIEVILDNYNSYQSDFVYVAVDKTEIVKDYIYGAPNMVIEVLWDKNAYYDLRPKKDTYEKHGVKEYIIFDPIEETAELHMLHDNTYKLHQKAYKSDELTSIVLPGLTFNLSKIFRDI